MSMTVMDLLAVSAVIAGYAPAAAADPPAVEVRSGGDDGLTQRFAVALETALGRSRIFTLSSRERPTTLVFEIPGHVEWTEIGGRIQIHFQVDFKVGDAPVIGTSRGSCWESDMNECVARVFSDAWQMSGHFSR